MEGFVVAGDWIEAAAGSRALGAMIFRRWGEFRDDDVQYARYPAGLCAGMSVRLCTRSCRSFTCYVSLFRCSSSPSLLLARSRSACLSPSYFDVILPCYYLDHRSRLAVREVAEKRDRDEPRSRKEVRELTTKPTLCPLPYRSCHRHVVWLFWRIV